MCYPITRQGKIVAGKLAVRCPIDFRENQHNLLRTATAALDGQPITLDIHIQPQCLPRLQIHATQHGHIVGPARGKGQLDGRGLIVASHISDLLSVGGKDELARLAWSDCQIVEGDGNPRPKGAQACAAIDHPFPGRDLNRKGLAPGQKKDGFTVVIERAARLDRQRAADIIDKPVVKIAQASPFRCADLKTALFAFHRHHHKIGGGGGWLQHCQTRFGRGSGHLRAEGAGDWLVIGAEGNKDEGSGVFIPFPDGGHLRWVFAGKGILPGVVGRVHLDKGFLVRPIVVIDKDVKEALALIFHAIGQHRMAAAFAPEDTQVHRLPQLVEFENNIPRRAHHRSFQQLRCRLQTPALGNHAHDRRFLGQPDRRLCRALETIQRNVFAEKIVGQHCKAKTVALSHYIIHLVKPDLGCRAGHTDTPFYAQTDPLAENLVDFGDGEVALGEAGAVVAEVEGVYIQYKIGEVGIFGERQIDLRAALRRPSAFGHRQQLTAEVHTGFELLTGHPLQHSHKVPFRRNTAIRAARGASDHCDCQPSRDNGKTNENEGHHPCLQCSHS